MSKPTFPLLLLAAAVSQLGATDCGEIIKDDGFDLWCGEVLCSWKLVRGEVRQVATWHEADSGVELLGTDTAISQMTPVNHYDTNCIRFDLVANVDESAEVRLNIDVYGDGSIELSERIPTSHWKPLSYKIAMAAPYTGVRFELTKRGTGTAVLAQISAETATGECTGLTPINGGPARNGAFCVDDANCDSGLCRYVDDPTALLGVARVCVGCDPDASTCTTGSVCGVGEAGSYVYRVPIECVPAAARELGEQCISNAECESNVCAEFVCSTCSATVACAGAEECRLAYPNGPALCSPGLHIRVSGEPCATDGDCASNQCNGAERKQCSDGRVCSSPASCPVDDDDGLSQGPCDSVGIQGGSCQ